MGLGIERLCFGLCITGSGVSQRFAPFAIGRTSPLKFRSIYVVVKIAAGDAVKLLAQERGVDFVRARVRVLRVVEHARDPGEDVAFVPLIAPDPDESRRVRIMSSSNR